MGDQTTGDIVRFKRGDDLPPWITVAGAEMWIGVDAVAYQDVDGVWHLRPQEPMGDGDAILEGESVPRGGDVRIEGHPEVVMHNQPCPDDGELLELTNNSENADTEQSEVNDGGE